MEYPSRTVCFQDEDGIRHHCVTVVQKCDFLISSRRRHTRSLCDWGSDVCSSDLSLIEIRASTLRAQNWLDLRAERGRSNFDQRHLVAIQMQYSTGVGMGGGTLDRKSVV